MQTRLLQDGFTCDQCGGDFSGVITQQLTPGLGFRLGGDSSDADRICFGMWASGREHDTPNVPVRIARFQELSPAP